MKIIKILSFLLIITYTVNYSFSQNATVKGIVYSSDNDLAPLTNVIVKNHTLGTSTNDRGRFELSVPANQSIVVKISLLGHEDYILNLNLKPNEISEHVIRLKSLVNILPTVKVEDNNERFEPITRLNPDLALKVPTPNSSVIDLVKLFASTSSNSELSSQYNVRGGNFDENMIFVNDIEIYRPMLVRSGNQEGMSFINSDMVSSILFSAGGFEAKYGDKMSSVLDIKYRKPREFAGSASASMLGGDIHVEGSSKDNLFKYNTGLRYKTTKYLLSSTNLNGEYNPNYLDFQTYLTYDISEKLELSFLGNISDNKYSFVPNNFNEAWGTINNAIGVNIYFDGQEIDRFTNYMGAFTAMYRKDANTNFKFILSGYNTKEKETFDILGEYYLNQLNTQYGSGMGDSVANIGTGKYLNHARNFLDGSILSVKHMGDYRKNNHNLLWGVQYNYEIFDFRVHEWNMIDSAGYSLIHNEDILNLYFVDINALDIKTSRLSAYLQDAYVFNLDKTDLSLGGGVRLNYWDYNNEFLFSPRLNIGLKPKNWNKNFVFRFSTGLYHQPPTLKEMKRLDGSFNKDIKAQSSFHVVLGSDYEFLLWNRPFKLVTEIYYKYLYNLNPYNVENVRIKYYGENIAKGFATGVELKLNGEFVPGTESWVSIGLMKTMEDIDGDFKVLRNEMNSYDTIAVGYIPRPTDQIVNVALFFQDYIPGNNSWQMHLSLLFGSRLPYGLLNSERHTATGRLNAYRRVDIGLSKKILPLKKEISPENFLHNIKEMWITLEAFNLLDIRNTISYNWVTSISGEQYGVPNYLTGRRINLKLVVKF
jgi:hypothetical protein